MHVELLDSRRLTGPNLLGDLPGAVIDVALGGDQVAEWTAAWEDAARRALEAVGWSGERALVRVLPGGASVALTAPIDALYAATELNEWAFEAAKAAVSGLPEPDLGEAARGLRATIDAERNPALLALRDAADAHGVSFLSDDSFASVGSGTGSRTFAVEELPTPDGLDWAQIHDVPVALVTGTNGKTTTVRLATSIAAAGGLLPGSSTTDWIRIGDETVDAGDWSGPGGARTVLRDRRVEVAILETARGGMLRRGLGVRRAEAACVLNVAEDHMGEWGIQTLDDLARAKGILLRAVARSGAAILNADDAHVAHLSGGLPLNELVWFSLDPSRVPAGDGEAWLLEEGMLVRRRGGTRKALIAAAEVPITLRAAARYNVSNALAACAVATRLGLPDEALVAGLARFGLHPEENPGRMNLYEVDGATVLADFAHNPHGMRALVQAARNLPAERRLIMIGQAGDRDDESIRAFAREAWELGPDLVVIKKMERYARGRDPEEVPRILTRELAAQGAPPEKLVQVDDEVAGVRAALAWARPGDLLLLPLHSHREEVLALLAELSSPPALRIER